MGRNEKNVSGVSWKKWQIERKGRRLTTWWGPAEIDPRSRRVEFSGVVGDSQRTFRSERAAAADETRRIEEKLREGYQRSPRRRPRKRSIPSLEARKNLARHIVDTRRAKSPLVRWTPTLARTKALSLRQFWASLVVNGWKDVENRSWRTNYRGPLLIHASRSLNDLETRSWLSIERKYGVDLPERHEIGGVIGVVEVVDCVRTHPSKWKARGSWGWVLQKPRRLRFRQCAGAVGLFKPFERR